MGSPGPMTYLPNFVVSHAGSAMKLDRQNHTFLQALLGYSGQCRCAYGPPVLQTVSATVSSLGQGSQSMADKFGCLICLLPHSASAQELRGVFSGFTLLKQQLSLTLFMLDGLELMQNDNLPASTKLSALIELTWLPYAACSRRPLAQICSIEMPSRQMQQQLHGSSSSCPFLTHLSASIALDAWRLSSLQKQLPCQTC